MTMNSSSTDTGNGTLSNTTVFPPLTHENWRTVIYEFLYLAEIAITVTALASNFAVVYAFIFYKKLRNSVTNYFVISLAVSDILTAGLVQTFRIEFTMNNYLWTHGELTCSLYTTMYLLAVPSSVINLCAVTVDRYLVLRMPLRYHTLMPPWRALLIICCLWIYAITWACLPVMGWNIGLPVIHNGYCYFVTTREYNVIVNVVNFLLPMVFMAIFWSFIYGIVLQHLKRVIKLENNISLNTNDSTNSSNLNDIAQANPVGDVVSLGNERRSKKRLFRIVRGTRYIGFIVVLFYFCWLPFVTLSMIGNLCKSCDEQRLIPYIAYDVLLVLGFMNSALNPFLYPFHDKHFKEAFRDTWRKMKNKALIKILCSREKV